MSSRPYKPEKQPREGQRVYALVLCALMTAPCGLAQQVPENAATTQITPAPSIAQQAQQAQRVGPVNAQTPFHVDLPHSHNPFAAYEPSTVPATNLANSPRLQNLIRDGKLYVSLHDAIALALENNLDLAYFRYNLPIADTDVARTEAGGQSNGVNTGIAQGTQGGFSSSGQSSSTGTGTGAGAAGAGGLVTSTLGNGTIINSFDPQVYFQGYVDHTTQTLTNTVLYGVPFLRTNTIYGVSQYSQAFPLGTNLQLSYAGERQTANSPFNIINPSLFSTFNLAINQPLLAGFGLATNERYIHIAKKNRQLTELAFRAQVIATITQVENIYWDLVNAYQDAQVKGRSLSFANETLSNDQKQLELQNIPALQVMKDQSDVATREGDLTVARATLKLNELLIKNALTKAIDDPALEDMPVIPLDRSGPLDQNAAKPIDQLIAEAEKNRPDVSEDEIQMQIAQNSLRTIKNELLPSLSVYGQFAGSGSGGLLNPYCGLGTECTTTLPTNFGGTFQNTFNYSSPEYQVGFKLAITLRNRIAKADQFRAVLEYRQKELTFEEQKKSIRFDVRNSQYALEQAQARVEAAQKASDLMQRTFDITKQEQKLGAKSSYDTLSADHDLAVAQSALVTAQTLFEKAKVDIDRATGETLDRMNVALDDAKTGVVTHSRP